MCPCRPALDHIADAMSIRIEMTHYLGSMPKNFNEEFQLRNFDHHNNHTKILKKTKVQPNVNRGQKAIEVELTIRNHDEKKQETDRMNYY